MRFESQTHPQDDHIGWITDCSTRYGQAPAVCTRVRLARGRWYLYELVFYWQGGTEVALAVWQPEHSPNTGTMLAHRLRRWPNIVPALAERLVLAAGSLNTSQLTQNDAGPTLHQHCVNVSS